MKLVVRFSSLKKYGWLALALFLADPAFLIVESWLNKCGIYISSPVYNVLNDIYIIAFCTIVFLGIKEFINNGPFSEKPKRIAKNILICVFCILIVILAASTVMTAKDNGLWGSSSQSTIAPNTQTKPQQVPDRSYQIFERMKEEAYEKIFDEYFKDEKYIYEIDYNAKGYSRLKVYEDETCIEFLMYDEASGEENIKYFVHYSFPKDESGVWDSLVADVVATYKYDTESQTAERLQ